MNTIADLKRALSMEATRLASSGGLESRLLLALPGDAGARKRVRSKRLQSFASPRLLALVAMVLTAVIVITLIFAAHSLHVPRVSPANVERPGTAVTPIVSRPAFLTPTDALVFVPNGQSVRILVTHDAGRNWYSVPIEHGFMDSAVWWIDRNQIVLDPWPDAIETTGDGGAHWTVHHSSSIDVFYGFFLNSSEGWTLQNSDPRGTFVDHTTDTGAHWETIATLGAVPTSANALGPLPVTQGVQILFTDRLHGFIGGTSADGVGRFFATSDGGRTWRLNVLPRPARGWGGGDGVVGIPRFFGSQGVLLYSATNGRSYLYSTTDSGSTWSNPRTFPYSSVSPSFADANDAWLINDDRQGTEYQTRDGGANWNRVDYTLPTGYVLDSVTPVGGQTLWGTASLGARTQPYVVRSVDGGATWSFVRVPAQ